MHSRRGDERAPRPSARTTPPRHFVHSFPAEARGAPWPRIKNSKKSLKRSCGFRRLRIDHAQRRGGHLSGNARGRLAQLVERLVYTEDVGSSSLSSPTIFSTLQAARIVSQIGAARRSCCGSKSSRDLRAPLRQIYEALAAALHKEYLPQESRRRRAHLPRIPLAIGRERLRRDVSHALDCS